MDSASIQFIFFGLAAAILSNFSRSRVWRSVVLMLASLIFLGFLSQSASGFVPLLGFLLFGYACLLMVRRGWPGATTWSVVAVIFVYVWLKKYTFLPEG